MDGFVGATRAALHEDSVPIDGFTDSAQVAYLQATEMGESVYERIGFAITERWAVFETP